MQLAKKGDVKSTLRDTKIADRPLHPIEHATSPRHTSPQR